ncbi:hypothetical protein Bbelb_274930 [Branchiostoma belcheri]|nr:hypothetical protein Bbelb_274930 [Branchiostoma belcheri]
MTRTLQLCCQTGMKTSSGALSRPAGHIPGEPTVRATVGPEDDSSRMFYNLFPYPGLAEVLVPTTYAWTVPFDAAPRPARRESGKFAEECGDYTPRLCPSPAVSTVRNRINRWGSGVSNGEDLRGRLVVGVMDEVGKEETVNGWRGAKSGTFSPGVYYYMYLPERAFQDVCCWYMRPAAYLQGHRLAPGPGLTRTGVTLYGQRKGGGGRSGPGTGRMNLSEVQLRSQVYDQVFCFHHNTADLGQDNVLKSSSPRVSDLRTPKLNPACLAARVLLFGGRSLFGQDRNYFQGRPRPCRLVRSRHLRGPPAVAFGKVSSGRVQRAAHTIAPGRGGSWAGVPSSGSRGMGRRFVGGDENSHLSVGLSLYQASGRAETPVDVPAKLKMKLSAWIEIRISACLRNEIQDFKTFLKTFLQSKIFARCLGNKHIIL